MLVRRFEERDAAALLALMRELAVAEDYIDEFAVTEHDLVDRSFGPNPQFHAWVAEEEGGNSPIGMAVAYVVPFTWTLRPTLYVKELFVQHDWRRHGVGTGLLQAVFAFAAEQGCGAVRASMFDKNADGQAFAHSVGGRHDSKWQMWLVPRPDIERLTMRRE